jgi:hypothetical protein
MTDLSPAAQAVMDAFLKAPMGQSHVDDDLIAIAAALRAAADIVVPPFINRPSTRTGFVKLNIRNRLQSLADQLEGRDATTL